MNKRDLLKGLISGEISLSDTGKLYIFQYITYLNGIPIKEDTFASDTDCCSERDRVTGDHFETLGAANANLTASGVMSLCIQAERHFKKAEDLALWQPLSASEPVCGLEYVPGRNYSEITPSKARSTAVISEEDKDLGI